MFRRSAYELADVHYLALKYHFGHL